MQKRGERTKFCFGGSVTHTQKKTGLLFCGRRKTCVFFFGICNNKIFGFAKHGTPPQIVGDNVKRRNFEVLI